MSRSIYINKIHEQYFGGSPTFNKRLLCNLYRENLNINQIFLQIKLPNLPNDIFTYKITKFDDLIKNVELSYGGQVFYKSSTYNDTYLYLKEFNKSTNTATFYIDMYGLLEDFKLNNQLCSACDGTLYDSHHDIIIIINIGSILDVLSLNNHQLTNDEKKILSELELVDAIILCEEK